MKRFQKWEPFPENNTDEEPEEFKPVKNFEDDYLISTKGRLIGKRGDFVKGWIKDGQLYATLLDNNKNVTYAQYKTLVASHFIENPNNYRRVIHKNGNPMDNRVNNLEWSNKYLTRKKLKNVKLSDKEILQIIKYYQQGITVNEISSIYNISIVSVYNILRGGRRIFKIFTIKSVKKFNGIKRGDGHYGRKLNTSDVLMIRKEYKKGKTTQKELAKKYNVSDGNIGFIVTGKSWKRILITRK